MVHPLETEYGLTATELLDAINRRFRAKVTLEGAVAEVHLGKLIKALVGRKVVARFQEHDVDGYADYTIWLPGPEEKTCRIECKNVRDKDEGYRKDGQVVAFKVETQKTRTSAGDKTSRFYGLNQFEILAVCLGKKTHDWHEFLFIRTTDLKRHSKHEGKLGVMHRVPLPSGPIQPPWYNCLESLIKELASD